MMGGLRLDEVRGLPLRYQEQAAAQVLERLAAAAPGILEEVRKLAICPLCGMAAVITDEDVGLRFCTECGTGWTRREAAAEEAAADPCLDCLRWGECNGVDESCPMR